MQVVNKSTGTGIPYATVTIYDDGGAIIFQNAADQNGNFNIALVELFLITGNDCVISAAGFAPYAASATGLLMQTQILLAPTILPEIVFTALLKAKKNPLITILIIVVIIALIMNRRQVVKIIA